MRSRCSMIWRTGSFCTSFTSARWLLPAMSRSSTAFALRISRPTWCAGSARCCGWVPCPERTAGIWPIARSLRAAPLPNDSRTAALTMFSSVMMFSLRALCPDRVSLSTRTRAPGALCVRKSCRALTYRVVRGSLAAGRSPHELSLAEVSATLTEAADDRGSTLPVTEQALERPATLESQPPQGKTAMPAPPTPTANIGVVGLAVMGSNLARNLASRAGNTVAVFNRSPERTRTLVAEHPEAGFVASETYDAFVASLSKPRTAIIMVQAGAGTDAVIGELVSRFEPGDIIMDGGNANFHDTITREATVRAKGIHFVGAGISGGEEGALHGPSIMPGGTAESYQTLGPILASIAAVAENERCVTHVGTDGAGHFVKMVHNGIEYADMQLIAEAYDLIRQGTGKSPTEIADIFSKWNTTELESYLIEITAEVLRQTDASTDMPLVDAILDQAGAKGTGAWTVQNALDLGVPVPGIAEAVFARSLSSRPDQRTAAASLPG